MAAAEAMRVHIQSALQNTLHRLEPYFERRKTDGKTFARSAVAATQSADSLG